MMQDADDATLMRALRDADPLRQTALDAGARHRLEQSWRNAAGTPAAERRTWRQTTEGHGRRLHLVAAAIAVFVVVIGGVVLSNLVTQRGARPQGGGHSRAGRRRGRRLVSCHRAIRRRVDAADDALRERVRAALDADEDVASYRFLDVPPPELDDDQATPVDDRLFIVAARYRDDVDIDAKIAADPGPVMDVEVGTPTVSGEEWAHVCSFSASDWIELDG